MIEPSYKYGDIEGPNVNVITVKKEAKNKSLMSQIPSLITLTCLVLGKIMINSKR